MYFVLVLVDLLTFVKTDKSLKLIFLNSVFLGLYSSLRQSKTNLIELKLSLKNLSGRKFIYTNASQDHAKNILSAMGIATEFEKILDIKATGYLPKPDPKSYDIMLKSFDIGANEIGNSIFIEDTAKNLKPAKLLGLKTVWIENDFNLQDYRQHSGSVDYKYSDLNSFLNDIDYRN